MTKPKYQGDPSKSAAGALGKELEQLPPFGTLASVSYALESGIKVVQHNLGYVFTTALVTTQTNGTLFYAVGDADATRDNGNDPKNEVIVTCNSSHIGTVTLWVF